MSTSTPSDMPKEAENIHGLSAEFLKDKPLFKTVARSFLEFIADSPLIIHNAGFDLKFLNYELDQLNLPQIPFDRAIDTVIMARKMFPGSPANLDALCKRYNIDASARTKHGALLDAELLADVYLEMKGGRQASLIARMDADTNGASSSQADGALAFSGHTDIPARQFPPSSEEVAAHTAMLAKLKNPVWLAENN